MQEVGEMPGKELDLCCRSDGLCARAGLVARARVSAKLGFSLGSVGKGAGRSPGRGESAPVLVQP